MSLLGGRGDATGRDEGTHGEAPLECESFHRHTGDDQCLHRGPLTQSTTGTADAAPSAEWMSRGVTGARTPLLGM